MYRSQINILLTALMTLALAGCVQTSRYQMKNDKAPLRKPTSIEMQSPTPKYEPIYPWSIKPYTVRGKRYIPLKTAKNYQAQGLASWYGRKFHGHTTANGEIYDMFAMTAAHKTLPIPSYVRVTNITNNKSIIVRVNDRGPFHHKRVIDLSYAAAYALNIFDHGVAEVKLQSIVVDKHKIPLRMESPQKIQQQQTNTPIINAHKVELKQPVDVKAFDHSHTSGTTTATTGNGIKQRFVQVFASQDVNKVKTLAKQLSAKYKQSHNIVVENGIYKLHLGPLHSSPQAQSLIEALQNNGYSGAYMLYTTASLPHN